jgi:hypothetical protein
MFDRCSLFSNERRACATAHNSVPLPDGITTQTKLADTLRSLSADLVAAIN